MPKVFISYRREDSAGESGRLGAELEARLGREQVFRDIEDIPIGEDFTRAIDQALASADVLLLIIGRDWLDVRDAAGRRRLDDPQDYVRLEVESARRLGVRVVPVLVQGASMPAERRLPPSLAFVTRIQAVELSDSRWDYDVGRLAAAVADGRAWRGGRRRRLRLLAGGAAAALAVLGAHALWQIERPPALGGVWHLANGNAWVVVQDGRRLTIEETHRDSRQVWKRGSGTIDGDRIAVRLDYVFERGYRAVGELRIAGDDEALTGTLVIEPPGRREPVTATRRPAS